MDNDSGVGVLDKAVRVLDALEDGPAALAELVSTHRDCRARRRTGWPWRSRCIGWSAAPTTVGSASASAWPPSPDRLVAAAGPVLADLRDETGESAQCYVRTGTARRCVAAAERRERPARHGARSARSCR